VNDGFGVGQRVGFGFMGAPPAARVAHRQQQHACRADA
jgi:hypothetical protein